MAYLTHLRDMRDKSTTELLDHELSLLPMPVDLVGGFFLLSNSCSHAFRPRNSGKIMPSRRDLDSLLIPRRNPAGWREIGHGGVAISNALLLLLQKPADFYSARHRPMTIQLGHRDAAILLSLLASPLSVLPSTPLIVIVVALHLVCRGRDTPQEACREVQIFDPRVPEMMPLPVERPLQCIRKREQRDCHIHNRRPQSQNARLRRT